MIGNWSRLLSAYLLVPMLLSNSFAISFYEPYSNTPYILYNWNDDFSDGDLNGWTVLSGTFTVENEVLIGGNASAQYTRYPYSIIYHVSSSAVGNWSFDILGTYWIIWFIASSPTWWNMSGYGIEKNYGPEPITFSLYKTFNGTMDLMERYRYSGTDDWHRINITRNREGGFLVYIDRGLVIEAKSTLIMESNYFVVEAIPIPVIANISLDNVVVATQELDSVSIIPYIQLIVMLVPIIVIALFIHRHRRIEVIENPPS